MLLWYPTSHRIVTLYCCFLRAFIHFSAGKSLILNLIERDRVVHKDQRHSQVIFMASKTSNLHAQKKYISKGLSSLLTLLSARQC